MRLLLFIDTDHLSGPARLALDFCVEASRQGHKPVVLGLVRGTTQQQTAFGKAMEEAGIETRLLHERFRFDPSVVRQFLAILDEFKPDLYQSHGYKGSLLGRFAGRRGVAWQAIFHGFTWENWRIRLYHALDVRWMRRADEVVAVSRDFERKLHQKGIEREKLRWIPNAISEDYLAQTRSGEDLRTAWLSGRDPEKTSIAGVIGRFSPEKGPDVFLHAMALAAQRNPDLLGVMLGDGPMLETSKDLAQRLGLTKRVLFPGFRNDLASVYEALDMLIIPSRSEGMPTVMIEAMLLGVPIVSTRVGAVPDIIRHGQTGLLAPIEDAGALAEAMLNLSADPARARCMADQARCLARERLTVPTRTTILIEHARCLISGLPLPAVDWKE